MIEYTRMGTTLEILLRYPSRIRFPDRFHGTKGASKGDMKEKSPLTSIPIDNDVAVIIKACYDLYDFIKEVSRLKERGIESRAMYRTWNSIILFFVVSVMFVGILYSQLPTIAVIAFLVFSIAITMTIVAYEKDCRRIDKKEMEIAYHLIDDLNIKNVEQDSTIDIEMLYRWRDRLHSRLNRCSLVCPDKELRAAARKVDKDCYTDIPSLLVDHSFFVIDKNVLFERCSLKEK